MAVKIFLCYAREDEPLLNRIKAHLKPLQRQGLIELWHDQDISAGAEWESERDYYLNAAQVILLLVSPDFMASDYCYGVAMQRALERHQRREARVIPVILRSVYWQGTLGKLYALPRNALPVTDPEWHNIDRALFSVAEGIREVVEKFFGKAAEAKSAEVEIEAAKPVETKPRRIKLIALRRFFFALTYPDASFRDPHSSHFSPSSHWQRRFTLVQLFE